MHWCADETNALIASLPVVGFVWLWLRAKWEWLKRRLLKERQ